MDISVGNTPDERVNLITSQVRLADHDEVLATVTGYVVKTR